MELLIEESPVDDASVMIGDPRARYGIPGSSRRLSPTNAGALLPLVEPSRRFERERQAFLILRRDLRTEMVRRADHRFRP